MNSTTVESNVNIEKDDVDRLSECRTLTTISTACLLPLVFFNLIQVLAAFFGINPHPPLTVIPMIVATAGIGIAALTLIRGEIREGYYLAIVFSVVSMIGMGPHKLFMENGLSVAPVTLLGFVAEIVLIVVSIKYLTRSR